LSSSDVNLSSRMLYKRRYQGHSWNVHNKIKTLTEMILNWNTMNSGPQHPMLLSGPSWTHQTPIDFSGDFQKLSRANRFKIVSYFYAKNFYHDQTRPLIKLFSIYKYTASMTMAMYIIPSSIMSFITIYLERIWNRHSSILHMTQSFKNVRHIPTFQTIWVLKKS